MTPTSFSDFPTLLDSIKNRFGTLPEDTVVYSGHGDTIKISDDEWAARGH